MGWTRRTFGNCGTHHAFFSSESMFVDVYLALSHLVTDAYGDFLSYFHGQYARVSNIVSSGALDR